MNRQPKSCRTCRSCHRTEEFSQAEGKMVTSETTGMCRRYPPQMVAPNQSSYPPVKLDGWACDEWKKPV
jgi:hypothetical protein